MTLTMQEAIAEVKDTSGLVPWDIACDAAVVILNAAASGDLIPKADAEQAVAEVARMRALVRRVVNDPVWRTNDNTLWPDLCAAIRPAQGDAG